MILTNSNKMDEEIVPDVPMFPGGLEWRQQRARRHRSFKNLQEEEARLFPGGLELRESRHGNFGNLQEENMEGMEYKYAILDVASVGGTVIGFKNDGTLCKRLYDMEKKIEELEKKFEEMEDLKDKVVALEYFFTQKHEIEKAFTNKC